MNWLLVKAAVCFCLERQCKTGAEASSDGQYKRLLTQFCLWLTERQVALLNPATATVRRVDEVMQMLQKVAVKAAKLEQLRFHMWGVDKRILTLRAQIDAAVSGRARLALTQFSLPAIDSLTIDDVRICMGAPPSAISNAADTDRMMELTLRNLGSVLATVPNLSALTIEVIDALDNWAQRARSGALVDVKLFSKSFEVYIIEACAMSQGLDLLDPTTPRIVDRLETLLDRYRQLAQRMMLDTSHRVEQLSKTTLVVWIVYCIIHSASKRVYPIIKGYGVCLKPDLLKYLSFRERSAVDACIRVVEYLRSNWNPIRAAFDLCNEKPTFDLASELARNDEGMQNVLQHEASASEARVQAHFVQVQTQQAEARRLRLEIATLESELEATRSTIKHLKQTAEQHEKVINDIDARLQAAAATLSSAEKACNKAQKAAASKRKTEWRPTYFQALLSAEQRKLQIQYDNALAALDREEEQCNEHLQQARTSCEGVTKEQHQPRSNAKSEMSTANSELAKSKKEESNLMKAIKQLQALLKSAETPPSAVFQPLPRNSVAASQVVFFMHSPPLLRSFARISLLAQQATIPNPWKAPSRWDLTSLTAVSDFHLSWVTYYNEKQTYSRQYHVPNTVWRGADGAVLLFSRCTVATEMQAQGSRTHIDQFTSVDHGVWWPDSLGLCMGWKTSADGLVVGSGSLFNPSVLVPDSAMICYYTEQLPKEAASLQWSLYLPEDVPKDRGNKSLASQDDRPEFLMKHEYVAFTTLRAYPYTQMRNLIVALHDHKLPFAQDAVHVLVRQALYQLGTLGNAHDGSDALEPLWKTDLWRGGLQTATNEIRGLARRHADLQRDAHAIVIISEMAAYVGQWHPPCASVCLDLAGAARRWSDELSPRFVNATGPEEENLRQRQCLFNIYAVLCCASVPQLDANATASVVCKAMVMIRSSLTLSESGLTPKLETLLAQLESVMATSIWAIKQAVDSNKLIVDSAVRLILQHAPEAMVWKAMSETDFCYMAYAGSDLYSINLLNGTVLFNGSPPGKLPLSIIKRSKYTRTFGSLSFQVSPHRGGFKTTKLIDGCFYEFYEDSSTLRIFEAPASAAWRLELLDKEASEAMPVRLRELHSQWLDEQRKLVVCRGINFLDKKVPFMLCTDTGACLRVPPHYQDYEPPALSDVVRLHPVCDIQERLIQAPSNAIVRILSKFEDRKFIHLYVEASAVAPAHLWRIELPRYGLSFEVRDGAVLSLDYRGYALSESQQLFDVLPSSFTIYLTLVRMDKNDVSTAEIMILVPDGRIELGDPIQIAGMCLSYSPPSPRIETLMVIAWFQLATNVLYAACCRCEE